MGNRKDTKELVERVVEVVTVEANAAGKVTLFLMLFATGFLGAIMYRLYYTPLKCTLF